MNNNDFFTILNKKLSILKENERKDIIDEYTNHIQLKIQDGKSEAEAIADFGDIDSLAQEILEAYHIDNRINSSHSIKYYLKTFAGYINDAVQKILNLLSKGLAKIQAKFTGISVRIANMLSNAKLAYSCKKNKDKDTDKEKLEYAYDKKKFTSTFKSGRDFLTSLLLTLAKLSAFIMFLIPLLLLTVTVVIFTVFIFAVMALSNIGFWGLCIISLGISIICISSTFWVANFIYARKDKNA